MTQLDSLKVITTDLNNYLDSVMRKDETTSEVTKEEEEIKNEVKMLENAAEGKFGGSIDISEMGISKEAYDLFKERLKGE